MEPSKAPRRFIYLTLFLMLAVIAGTLINDRWLQAPLGKSVKADLPMLDLVIKLRDVDGKDLPADGSRIADDRELPPGDEHCPELVGGDSREATTWSASSPRPADCPKRATWYVKRRPIALSIYVEDGKKLLDWSDRHQEVQAWLTNRFTRGLFYGFLNSLKVKAEDLNLGGLKGEFLGTLMREALVARPQLHYDMVHGKQGWVFSFARADSSFAGKALPIMVHSLAKNGYRIAALPEPVLEMRIGLQRLFLTQYDGRVYLGQGLEALLNVVDGPAVPTGGIPDAPVSVTVRAEAFMDKFLPVMAGTPHWDVTAAFDLQNGKLGSLRLPSGQWDKHLHSRIFDGVLASIPHDAFAAAATSLQLAPMMTQEQWRTLATEGPDDQAAGAPEQSGFALVWDFDGRNSPMGALGIIIANQTDPRATPAYQQYLTDPELSAECAGGAIFLAATSQRLLARMQQSCGRQSLSPLDWERGSGKGRYAAAQLMTFVNLGAGMRELFLAGGAGAEGDELNEFAPRWKQDYEKAKSAMRADGDKLFGQLPIFAYAGRSGGGPVITLDGQAVSQGIAP